MSNFLAWSYSRLKTYKACPGQLYHTQVAPRGHPDRVDYVETDAMRAGKEVDDALTKRIRDDMPLPEQYQKFEGIAQLVLAHPGNKLLQAQYALDQAMRPCGYKDWGNAWVRVIYDLAIVDRTRAWLWDWKNGKIWIDEDQLRLFATVGFHQFPEVEVIDTAYVWLSHNHISPKIYHRRELPDLWHTFLPDVERMQSSYTAQHWPKTPSKKACKWCEVNKAGKCPVAAVPYAGKA